MPEAYCATMYSGYRKAISRMASIGIVVIIVVIVAGAGLYLAYAPTTTTSTTTTSTTTTSSQTPVAVTFGVPVKASYQFMPAFYAANNSYFANNGIDATVQAFTGDAALQTAIATGQIQIGMDNVFSIMNFISAGDPIKIIAQVTSANDFVVIVPANSTHTTAQSMNNTKLGVTTIPGLTYQLAVNFGTNNSINITPVAQGGLTTQVAGMQQNAVQGFLWTFDQGYNLQALNQGRILANLSDYYPQWKTEMVLFASTSIDLRHNYNLASHLML